MIAEQAFHYLLFRLVSESHIRHDTCDLYLVVVISMFPWVATYGTLITDASERTGKKSTQRLQYLGQATIHSLG